MGSTEWPKRSPLAILLSVGATLLSLVGAFYALVFAALTCDESCDDRSSAWRDNPDAWQWLGQFGLGRVRRPRLDLCARRRAQAPPRFARADRVRGRMGRLVGVRELVAMPLRRRQLRRRRR